MLTNDQLFEAHVIWTLGADPFEFAPRSAHDDAKRHREFQQMLERGDPDSPWDPLAETLLDATLTAFHFDESE